MSGSESLASELAGKEIGSVPREWECIAVHAGQECCHLGCPTYVGMNRTSGNYSRKGYDFSHTRGNESGKVTFGTIFSKFVPREWE